jgi:predicted Fe-S protein YdhL (DUF1289 family)
MVKRKNKNPPTILNPCVNICIIENNSCIGCKRTQKEISEWFWMEDETKQKIMMSLKER